MKRFHVLAGVLLTVGLAGCAPTAPPTSSPVPSSTPANLALLSEPAADDEPTVDLGAAVDNPEAVRFLGATGGVEAFAVENGDQQVCLVLTGASVETVASCYDNAVFNEFGIEITLEGAPTRTFYLLADRAERPTSAEEISANLWVATA